MFWKKQKERETKEPALRLAGEEAHLILSEELRAAFMPGGCWADRSLRKVIESLERCSLEDIERDAGELKAMYQKALEKGVKDKPWVGKRQKKLGMEFEGWLTFLQIFDTAREEGITELGIHDYHRMLFAIPKRRQAAAIKKMSIERAMYEIDIEFPKQTIALIRKLRRYPCISQAKMTSDELQRRGNRPPHEGQGP
jgi:hypothetical protein